VDELAMLEQIDQKVGAGETPALAAPAA